MKELGEFFGGSTPSTTDPTLWGGDIHWLVPSEISGIQECQTHLHQTENRLTQKGYDSCSTHLLPPGTVAVSSRATVGDCIICGREICTNQGFVNIVCNDRMNNLFLLYWLRQNKRELLRYAAGTTFDEIGRGTFKKLQVAHPIDPREQQAIAEALSAVDSTVNAARESIAKAERLQKALMQHLLTGRLKPDSTPRSTSDFMADDHFGRLPRGWQSVRVKNLISSCEYGLSRAMSEHGHYPIFRMNNIERGRMVGSPLAYIDLSPEDFARYRVRKGDILFNRTNTVELVGKVGIFALEGDFVFASYLVRLVASEENDPRFLNYYLNSFEGQKRIAAKVTPSIGQANINTRSLKSVWAIKPPRGEQSAIADRIDAFFDLITAKEEKIAALQKLKKSLMQHLLTGRIRLPVPRDGKQEP